eukprot:2962655-Pleurochrysis_carterae.AAC.1
MRTLATVATGMLLAGPLVEVLEDVVFTKHPLGRSYDASRRADSVRASGRRGVRHRRRRACRARSCCRAQGARALGVREVAKREK